MNVIWSVIGAFCTSIAYAVVLNTPRNTLLASACNGALAWLLFQILQAPLGIILSMYIASLTMALGSQVLARAYKTPVTIILIPSFIPFVPGGDIYRCIYYLFIDDVNLSLHYLGNTLMISGLIALGAMSVEAWIMQLHKERNKRKWKEFLS